MRILFFCCLFFSFSSIAQEVTFGPEQKLNRQEFIQGIVHHDDTGFYVTRSTDTRNIILEKYGNDLDLKLSSELVMGENYTMDEIFGFQGKLYASFNQRDKKNDKINYYLQELSTDKGIFKGKKRLLNTGKMDARNSRGSLLQTTSRDSRYIAFFSSDQPVSGFIFGDPFLSVNNQRFNEFKVNVFDTGMNESWKKSIRMPYDKDDIEIASYKIDNEGNLYFLIEVYLEDWKRKRRNLEPFKKYQILAYTNQGEVKKKYELKLRNRFITDITFEIDDFGNIVCAGFMNESGKESISGAFYFLMNSATEDFIKEEYKDFKPQELVLFMNERKARKGKEISANYSLDHLILREDGGVILLAEYFDIQQTQDFAGPNRFGAGGTRTIFYHNDVLTLSIDPDGQIDWLTKMPKFQSASSPRNSSYYYALVDDKIQFVYNRNISRRTDIQLTYIDSDGRLGGRDLFNARREKVLLLPAGCRQINDREMIIYGEWNRKFQFGKVTF